MHQKKQLLVAELTSPQHAEEVTCAQLFSSLKTSVVLRYGDDMRSSVKWVYRLPSLFLVLIDNENITRKLASEVSTKLKLHHPQLDEITIDVCFSLLTNDMTFPTEYLLVGCDDTTLLLDLPYDIQTSLKELSTSEPSLLFTRCGSIV